jgi:hypothetical protein
MMGRERFLFAHFPGLPETGRHAAGGVIPRRVAGLKKKGLRSEKTDIMVMIDP